MIKTRPKINPLSHQEANLRIPHQKRSNRAKAINKPRAPYLSPRKPRPKIARKLYEIAPHTHLEISIRGARSRSEQEQKKNPKQSCGDRSIDGSDGFRWIFGDFRRGGFGFGERRRTRPSAFLAFRELFGLLEVTGSCRVGGGVGFIASFSRGLRAPPGSAYRLRGGHPTKPDISSPLIWIGRSGSTPRRPKRW